MKKIEEILVNNPILSKIKKGNRIICNDSASEALLVAASFLNEPKKILLVKPNNFEALQTYNSLKVLLGENVLLYPAEESVRMVGQGISPENTILKVATLYQLMQDKPMVLIVSTQGLIKPIPSRSLFNSYVLDLKEGDIWGQDKLLEKLISLGYKKSLKVEQSLEYAHRGSVIDVFSLNYDDPLRIDFFDDEIETIKTFDINEQKSKEHIKKASILPATYLLNNDLEAGIAKIKEMLDKQLQNISSIEEKDKLTTAINSHIEILRNNEFGSIQYCYYSLLNEDAISILDFFGPDLTFISNYESIKSNYFMYQNESNEYFKELIDNHEWLIGINHCLDISYIFSRSKNNIYLEDEKEKVQDDEFFVREINSCNANAKLFIAVINKYLIDGNKIYICLPNEKQRENVSMWLEEALLNKNKDIKILDEEIPEGYEFVKEKVVFISGKEIFNSRSNTMKMFNKFKSAVTITSTNELNPYDYVVHEEHGIGQYLGIKTMEVDGIHRDYLQIMYHGNFNLYVPLDQFSLVRKYVGQEGKKPRLNSINSKEWKATKEKIKNRVNDIAEKLIDLYKERTKEIGYAFSKEDELERSFDNDFPYVLTKDQEIAVKEIKKDMEKPYPMDRLICGDVGFGKTEVAFRAAFKAIKDGKQVAIICPTTILARQHYYKALERFQNFDLRIELVSRLVPDGKQHQIAKDLEEGKVNIIIGTQRLLSPDFKYKDLGLLIIDEEQKFGVEHKEKIKELKRGVDVLTLSATPIPRTLQMSLLGIKELSQIQTPPSDRIPVQTYVMAKNERNIKEIIERELGRGGQVFYLHNKTSDIYALATKISKSIPAAKVGVGHGKMSRDEIEDIMVKFYNGEINVLICTTIIESGLDIPNANTIIVEDADKLGLSQLYQIKGRVGRSDRMAYAYLLYQPNKVLNEDASKRLKAIKEFTELGSGYKIALRDLSIRGAGDILGAEQAGFIDDVGMDMYMSLLEDAIKEKKNIVEDTKTPKAPKAMQLDSYVPTSFAKEDANKFEIYKEIEKVKNLKEIFKIEDKIKDNYGHITKPVQLLIEKKKIDILSSEDWVSDIKETNEYVDLYLTEEFSKTNNLGVDLFNITNEIDYKNIELSFRSSRIRVRIYKREDWSSSLRMCLEKITKLYKEGNKKESN